MKEYPILFSSEMVRAILDGRKTQTRRIVKGEASDDVKPVLMDNEDPIYWAFRGTYMLCPYGQPGDQLWVRERGYISRQKGAQAFIPYVGNETQETKRYISPVDNLPFKGIPSIHMPRWASRIQLGITSVRIERLNEISEQDAKAEGLVAKQMNDGRDVYQVSEGVWSSSPRIAYGALWNSINGADAWAKNPWVWVIKFNRIKHD